VADQARSAGTADPEDPWFGATIVPGAEPTTVAVSGELDMCTLEQLRAVLDQLRRTGHHHVMLDLAGLDFLSATGISVIAEHLALTTRAAGGSLALSNPSPPIRRVLILTDHQPPDHRLDAPFPAARGHCGAPCARPSSCSRP
jgi:anti-sigma B factor antagonist